MKQDRSNKRGHPIESTARSGGRTNSVAFLGPEATFTHEAAVALFGYLNRWNDTMATDLEGAPGSVAERAIGSAGWDPGKHG